MDIRLGKASDLDSILRIYNHYVSETHATFDLEPRSLDERRSWFERFAGSERLRLLVASDGGRVQGYACSTPFKSRPAYSVSVETSVYLDPESLGRGIGRRLLETLLEQLEGTGVHGAYAGICLPNEASVRLHESLGYRLVGTLSEVGYKFDRYWDVAWYERRIGH